MKDPVSSAQGRAPRLLPPRKEDPRRPSPVQTVKTHTREVQWKASAMNRVSLLRQVIYFIPINVLFFRLYAFIHC